MLIQYEIVDITPTHTGCKSQIESFFSISDMKSQHMHINSIMYKIAGIIYIDPDMTFQA